MTGCEIIFLFHTLFFPVPACLSTSVLRGSCYLQTLSLQVAESLYCWSQWRGCKGNSEANTGISGDFPNSRADNSYSVSSAMISRLKPDNLKECKSLRNRVDQSPNCADRNGSLPLMVTPQYGIRLVVDRGPSQIFSSSSPYQLFEGRGTAHMRYACYVLWPTS